MKAIDVSLSRKFYLLLHLSDLVIPDKSLSPDYTEPHLCEPNIRKPHEVEFKNWQGFASWAFDTIKNRANAIVSLSPPLMLAAPSFRQTGNTVYY